MSKCNLKILKNTIYLDESLLHELLLPTKILKVYCARLFKSLATTPIEFRFKIERTVCLIIACIRNYHLNMKKDVLECVPLVNLVSLLLDFRKQKKH